MRTVPGGASPDRMSNSSRAQESPASRGRRSIAVIGESVCAGAVLSTQDASSRSLPIVRPGARITGSTAAAAPSGAHTSASTSASALSSARTLSCMTVLGDPNAISHSRGRRRCRSDQSR